MAIINGYGNPPIIITQKFRDSLYRNTGSMSNTVYIHSYNMIRGLEYSRYQSMWVLRHESTPDKLYPTRASCNYTLNTVHTRDALLISIADNSHYMYTGVYSARISFENCIMCQLNRSRKPATV